MTATETEFPAGADLQDRLRGIDRRLDGLADLVGGLEMEVSGPSLRRELDDLRDELAVLADQTRTEGDDDPFSSAGAAVAVRRERLGFIRGALEGIPPERETSPVARPATRAPRRTGQAEGERASSTGRVLSILGLVVIGFFAYTLTIASLVHARQQKVLLEEFKQVAPLQAADPTAAQTQGGAVDGILTGGEAAGDPTADAEAEPTIIPAAEAPLRGEPIGVIEIPRIDVEEVVVQGSGPAELRGGPGHLRGTPMPGEPGNAAIAGARLGGGAPFRRLQMLDKGDRILVSTARGTYRYVVRSVVRVGDGDPDPVRSTGGAATLTLITSTPKFLAYDQLVAVADLEGTPVKPLFKPVTADTTDSGFDPGRGLAPVLVWGLALGLAIACARVLYRRWPRPVSYLITTPILLALLILLFESIAGVLPATF